MGNLEALLREVISQGQPKTHKPRKKISIIVEGLYSVEGSARDFGAQEEVQGAFSVFLLQNLPHVLKQFYLFVDEAHSIGALGPHNRGVADYFGVNPRSIDILMGMFTKSFGAAGGHIAGNKTLIDRLRVNAHSGAYAEAMTLPASMASIMGIAVPSALVRDVAYHAFSVVLYVGFSRRVHTSRSSATQQPSSLDSTPLFPHQDQRDPPASAGLPSTLATCTMGSSNLDS